MGDSKNFYDFCSVKSFSENLQWNECYYWHLWGNEFVSRYNTGWRKIPNCCTLSNTVTLLHWWVYMATDISMHIGIQKSLLFLFIINEKFPLSYILLRKGIKKKKKVTFTLKYPGCMSLYISLMSEIDLYKKKVKIIRITYWKRKNCRQLIPHLASNYIRLGINIF